MSSPNSQVTKRFKFLQNLLLPKFYLNQPQLPKEPSPNSINNTSITVLLPDVFNVKKLHVEVVTESC